MTPAATALSILRESRDAERDAPIWRDNGRTVAHLAQAAGVVVTYAHCDLTRLATEYRTAGKTGEEAAQSAAADAPQLPPWAAQTAPAGR